MWGGSGSIVAVMLHTPDPCAGTRRVIGRRVEGYPAVERQDTRISSGKRQAKPEDVLSEGDRNGRSATAARAATLSVTTRPSFHPDLGNELWQPCLHRCVAGPLEPNHHVIGRLLPIR